VLRTELTAAGRRALERCDRAVDEVERALLAGVDAREAAKLRDGLVRCGRTLEVAER
jgi:DNA-binding MarR family transcriptional regulator